MNAPLVLPHTAGRIHVLPDGRTFHVGGRRPRASRGPRVRLARYLDTTKLPAPAPDVDYTKGAQGLSDVLANNSLGDCTCAGVGHLVDVVTAGAGAPVAVTADQVIALYRAACGYDGTPATDQGGDELTVLDYVCEKGLDGAGLHKFDASVLVDVHNKEEVRAAMWLFGNLYFGCSLPDAWISPFPSANGFVWAPGTPDNNNGHCFVGVGSDSNGVQIDTWGLLGTITYDAIAQTVDELHTVLTCDWFNKATQLAPSGFAVADLLADLKELAVDSLLSD